MTTDSKADSKKAKEAERFMPKMAGVELTIVDTADLTIVLKSQIEQNQRLLNLVETMVNMQMQDKIMDRQLQQERVKRQDEMTDYLKAMLPTLLDWIKPGHQSPIPPFETRPVSAPPKVHSGHTRRVR